MDRKRSTSREANEEYTIAEMVRLFWRHAKKHYRKNGEFTNEIENLKYALNPLLALYPDLPVAEFSPLKLKAVRAEMMKADLCRNQINDRIGRIKRVFRWAVTEEIALRIAGTPWTPLPACGPAEPTFEGRFQFRPLRTSSSTRRSPTSAERSPTWFACSG